MENAKETKAIEP